MTDESELTFHERVEADLKDHFGKEAVHSEVALPTTARRVDIMMETPHGAPDFAIEVENDWEACVKGHGQATLYAEQTGARPFVVVPEGHVEMPEALFLFSGRVTLVQYPV
jgi:hypothetical protein